MYEYKEEGNQVFKERNVKMAMELYASSLIIGRMLQTHHYVEVDTELQSSLLSNMALCALKMVSISM